MSSAFSVRHTPPPETPAHKRHASVPAAPQSGETRIAVTRLAVLLVAPEKAVTPGWVALVVGPKSDHLWPFAFGSPVAASLAAIFSNVAPAWSGSTGGISSAG